MYFFEDLAHAYNRNELSRRQIHETFPAPPLQIFTEGWWYVSWQRGGNWAGPKPWRFTPEWLVRANPRPTDLYAQFGWMVAALRNRVPSEKETDWPAARRFVLCLPPEDERRLAGPWARSRTISHRLTEYGGGLKALVERLEDAQGPPASSEGWEIVIVPPSIDASKDEADHRQWLAGRIESCIPRLSAQAVTDAVAAAVSADARA